MYFVLLYLLDKLQKFTVKSCKTQKTFQYRFIVIIFKLLFEVLILYIIKSVIDKDEAFHLLEIYYSLSFVFIKTLIILSYY